MSSVTQDGNKDSNRFTSSHTEFLLFDACPMFIVNAYLIFMSAVCICLGTLMSPSALTYLVIPFSWMRSFWPPVVYWDLNVIPYATELYSRFWRYKIWPRWIHATASNLHISADYEDKLQASGVGHRRLGAQSSLHGENPGDGSQGRTMVHHSLRWNVKALLGCTLGNNLCCNRNSCSVSTVPFLWTSRKIT